MILRFASYLINIIICCPQIGTTHQKMQFLATLAFRGECLMEAEVGARLNKWKGI